MPKIAANQYKVLFNDKMPTDREHPYFITNVEAFDLAFNELKQNYFKLWIYLVRHSNNGEWILSGTAFEKEAGVSNGTYQKAVQELASKGYLELVNDRQYEFHPMPKNSHSDDTVMYGF